MRARTGTDDYRPAQLWEWRPHCRCPSPAPRCSQSHPVPPQRRQDQTPS